MSEKNCMKCHVFWFKQSLCKGDFCDEYWAEGREDDFINAIKPKWIPCSEQLPEEGEVVLTQAKFEDDIKMAVSARVDFNYWTGWGTREINIVAWMPLPEPYGGDSK